MVLTSIALTWLSFPQENAGPDGNLIDLIVLGAANLQATSLNFLLLVGALVILGGLLSFAHSAGGIAVLAGAGYFLYSVNGIPQFVSAGVSFGVGLYIAIIGAIVVVVARAVPRRAERISVHPAS